MINSQAMRQLDIASFFHLWTSIPSSKRVLIIEPNPIHGCAVLDWIRPQCEEVWMVSSAEEAWKKYLTRFQILLVFCAVDLPNKQGLSFVKQMKKQFPNIEFVLMGGQQVSPRLMVEGMKAGAMDWIKKPLRKQQVLSIYRKVLKGKSFCKNLPNDLLTQSEFKKTAMPLNVPLQQVEYRWIEYVLAQCEGNKSRAADLLGISRRALYQKLKKNFLAT